MIKFQVNEHIAVLVQLKNDLYYFHILHNFI